MKQICINVYINVADKAVPADLEKIKDLAAGVIRSSVLKRSVAAIEAEWIANPIRKIKVS